MCTTESGLCLPCGAVAQASLQVGGEGSAIVYPGQLLEALEGAMRRTPCYPLALLRGTRLSKSSNSPSEASQVRPPAWIEVLRLRSISTNPRACCPPLAAGKCHLPKFFPTVAYDLDAAWQSQIEQLARCNLT